MLRILGCHRSVTTRVHRFGRECCVVLTSNRHALRGTCLAGLLCLAIGCSSDGGDEDGNTDTSGGGSSSTAHGGASAGSGGLIVGGASSGNPNGGASASNGDRCADAERLGGVTVVLEDGYTAVSGKFVDEVVPQTILTQVATDQGCVLIKREYPRCSPACGSTDICRATDNVCVLKPTSKSVGTVTVTGLSGACVMDPVQPGNSYFLSGENNVPHPGFVPDAHVSLAAKGADLQAFSLDATGVSPLEVTSKDWTLEKGRPLAVNWKSGSVASAHIRVTLNVDQHGNSPVTMTCVTNDDGAFEVPSTLVDSLIDSGVTGFPKGSIYRETAGSATLSNGCVDLVLASHVDATLRVAGFTPCSQASPTCPSGQTCNLTVELCQ